MLHRPLYEIDQFPLIELLRWQVFFRTVGPLDWEREDLRDARRMLYQYGADGKVVKDFLQFPRAEKPPTEIEEAIISYENDREEIAKLGNLEAIEMIDHEIHKLKLKALLEGNR